MVEQKFRKSPEIIVSYPYTDIADGTGIVNMTAFNSRDSTGIKYHASQTTTFYSSDIESSSGFVVNNGTFVKCLDLDWDMGVFNTPREIRGNSEIRLSYFATRGDVSSSYTKSMEYYIIFKVRKWDGLSETEIASVQGQTRIGSVNASTNEDYQTDNLLLTIPLTHFKRGENIRITIEGYVKQTSSIGEWSNYKITVGNDPQNRAGSFLPANLTKLFFTVPFNIQD